MNNLEKNKMYLKEHADSIYQNVFEKQSNYPALKITRTARGLQGVCDEVECYLSSTYDQEQEYRDAFAHLAIDTKVIIYFGTFDPKLVYFLKTKFRSLYSVMFVDPATQILQAVLEELDLEETMLKLQSKHIVLFPNIDAKTLTASIAAEAKYIKERSMVFSLAYQTLFPDYIRSFFHEFKEMEKINLINLVTLNGFSIPWMTNAMYNYMQWVHEASSLMHLIQGKYVIIVSAGPSLQKNVQLLKAAYDQAIIIAVGSSVPILNELGIRPHFNAGLDLFQGAAFSNLHYPEVPLLFGYKISHETLDWYQGEKFCFISEVDFLEKYLWADASNEDYVCQAGISVATPVLSLVSKLGAKSVIFIGQDMCLYDNKVHLLDQEGDETVLFDGISQMQDIYGQTVLAPRKYWAIKPFLERIIAAHPEVRYINATEGGLGLEGAENDTLAHVLSQIAVSDNNDFQEEIRKIAESIAPTRFMDKMHAKNVFEEAGIIKEKCLKTERYIYNIGKLRKNNAQNKKIDKEISKLDRNMEELEEIAFYGALKELLAIRFDIAIAEYEMEKKSKDLYRLHEAKIKYFVAIIVPVKLFCTHVLDLYDQIIKGKEIDAQGADVDV